MIPELERWPMPERIARLPRDERGYPVPKFVHWQDGEPQFPVVQTSWLFRAVRQRRCWICGDHLGRSLAFVIGPMCAVNRISSEPPSHRECAEYACRVCPFLARPHMRRLLRPAGAVAPGGFMVAGNPGLVLLWITRSYEPIRPGVGNDGLLFEIGDPIETLWFHRGELADPERARRGFEEGCERLRKFSIDAGDPQDGTIERMIEAAARLLPRKAKEIAHAVH